tara:strand:+ start:116 stop:613 length:498 start_codon:yes stop_codon:yes gene_type:complete
MGVAGAGKTTIGKLLARRLGGDFLDADDLHSSANIQKMSRGEPLDDGDRWPWLDVVAHTAREHTGPFPLVLACSALKEAYRERLGLGQGCIVFLTGPRDTIEQRLESRPGHFMPSQLLDSQLEILEEPDWAITVSVTNTPDGIVKEIIHLLHRQSDDAMDENDSE